MNIKKTNPKNRTHPPHFPNHKSDDEKTIPLKSFKGTVLEDVWRLL